MRVIEIAIGTTLRIPDGWSAFTYRGFLYRRGEDGRFLRVGGWGESQRNLSMETERNRDSLTESTGANQLALARTRASEVTRA